MILFPICSLLLGFFLFTPWWGLIYLLGLACWSMKSWQPLHCTASLWRMWEISEKHGHICVFLCSHPVGLHPNAELQRIHWLDGEGSHGWQLQRRKVKGLQCKACLHGDGGEMKVVKEEWSELQTRCSRAFSLPSSVHIHEGEICLFVCFRVICLYFVDVTEERGKMGAWCAGRHMHALVLVWCPGVKYLSISRLTVSKHEAFGDPCYLLSFPSSSIKDVAI